jgi:autotransporter-associated beta strand protein
VAAACLFSPQDARAQSGTWASGTGAWSDASKWTGGTIANGSGNTATFTTSGSNTITLDSNRTIGAIAVTTANSNRPIDGPTFTLTLATTPGSTPTLSGTTGSTLSITPIVAGTQGLLKTNAGTLNLTAANTFTGTVLLQAGTTAITNVAGLGATGAGNETAISSGAQLQIATGGTPVTIAESFSIAGRGNPTNIAASNGGAIRILASNVTLTGAIMLTGTAEIFPNSASTLTVSGPITGTGGFIARGSGAFDMTGNMSHDGWFNRWSGGTGVVTLSGSNSYTGATAIDSGPAVLNNAYALPAATALSVTGATGLLDLNGYDTTIRTFGWREDGVNAPNQNNSTGGTITDNSATPGTSTITVTSGSFILGTAINDGASGRKVALSVAAGGGANLANIELNNASSTFSGGLTILNGADRGTRLRIDVPVVNTGSPGAITSSPFGTGTISLGLNSTDKVQLMSGTGSYVGGVGSTILNDIIFNSAQGTDFATGVLLNATETTFAGTLVAGQASITIATGAQVPNSIGVLSGRVTSTGSSGGLVLRDSGQTPGLTVRLFNATGTANDYQGTTSIEANTTLLLGAANQVPNGVGKGNVSVSGNFNLGGFSDTINGLSGSGSVEAGGGTPTFTVGDGDATASFGGVLGNASGALSLVKIGSGVQTLAGANTYSGPTSVSAGTLLVNGDQSGATGAVTVAAGATLGGTGIVGGATTIQSGATLSPGASPGTLSFTQGLTLAAGGNYNWQILNATGTAGATDGWDFLSVGGVLDVASTSADPFKINLWSLSSTGPDVNGNALNFDASQGSTWKIASATGGITGFDTDKFQIITGATNGTGGFTNAFTGTFSLALSGSTDLNLVYTAGAPAVITINVPSGTQTQTAAGHPLLAGTTPVEKTGAGTVVFDQPNTLTGPTSVTQGTLELATADTLSSSAVTVAAGATLSVAPQVSATIPSLVNNGLVDVGLGELTVVSGLTAEGLKAEILAGRNEGEWNGATGITSSAAAGVADRAVGWIDNGDGSFRFGFAAAGDLDMNGLVDLDDVIAFVGGGLYDTGSPAVWAQGDYDYNGIVDLDDVIAFVGGGLYDKGPYNQPEGGMSLLAFGDDPGLMNGGFAAVPEPSTWVLATIGVGVAAHSLRRRMTRSAQRRR